MRWMTGLHTVPSADTDVADAQIFELLRVILVAAIKNDWRFHLTLQLVEVGLPEHLTLRHQYQCMDIRHGRRGTLRKTDRTVVYPLSR